MYQFKYSVDRMRHKVDFLKKREAGVNSKFSFS